MKKVLFISYYFPPLGGVGPQRVLRVLPHLPRLGWMPSVLTVTEGSAGELHDETLAKKIPAGTKIYRTPAIDLKKPARWLEQRHCTRLSWLWDRFMECPPPDRHIGWLPSAGRKAREIISREGIDAVITISAPYSTHLLGWRLKHLFGKPWIADFRDEWAENPVRRPLFSWQRWLDAWLERKVLHAADRVLMTTPSYCRSMAQRLPLGDRDKVRLWTNGFDRQDFPVRPSRRQDQRLRIVYAGSLYGPQNPRSFLRALEACISRGSIPSQALEVLWIGRASAEIEPEIQRFRVAGTMRRIPFATHEETIRQLQEADVLLLLVGGKRGAGNIPAKTFEYLAAGKPILALVDSGGETARILRECAPHWLAGPDSQAEIETALVELYRSWKSSTWPTATPPEAVERFEAGALAAQLGSWLDTLCGVPPRIKGLRPREPETLLKELTA